MTDLATLSLKIDSSGMTLGNKALDEFANKATAAEGAANRISSGAAQVGARFAQATPQMNAAAAAAKMTGYQYQQLGFQVNDVVTQLASGAPAFQVLAQQGGQVYQVLGQGPGGVGGALNALGASLGRIATSVPGVFGIATAAAVGFGLVLNKITDDQRNLERALTTGLGRGAGVSPDAFRSITDAAASAAQVSKSTAQDIGLAFAQTGKIGGAMFGDLTVLASRFGLTVGVDAVDAAKELGKAFADPIRGMEAIEKRVGALDDATREYVRNAMMVGDTFGAQQALARGLEQALVKLPQRIETLGDAWTRLKNAVSNGASALLGISTLSERIKGAEAELAGLQRTQGAFFGSGESRIRAAMEKLSSLYEEQAEATRKAREEQERFQKNSSDKAIRDATQGHLLEMQAIAAKTEVEKAAIAGQQAYNQAIESGLNVQAARVLQINAEERALASLKASIDQTIRSTQDQTAASNLGANILGMGGGMGAATAAMEKYTQLAQLQREIDAADGQAKADLQEKYRALAAAIDENTAARARLQAAQSIDGLANEAEILRKKIALHGEENSYIEKKIALLQVEQQIRASGLDPSGAEAMEWRRRAEEVANLKTRLEELNGTADRGESSAKRLGEAWKSAAASIQQTAMAAVGANSALQTMFAGAWGGGGGASGGTFAIGSTNFFKALGAYGAFQREAKADNAAQQSALRNTISTLEKNLQGMQGRWDTYQPSAYAEKNPLLFYDFQQGSHFTEAERTQISKMEEQIATAQKQLVELERIAQLLNMSAMQALRDPFTTGPFARGFTSVGMGALIQEDLAPLWQKYRSDNLYGFASGGSFMVNGMSGTDRNVMAINGQPIAKVSQGERVTIETPAQQRSKMEAGSVDKRDQRQYHITIQMVAANDTGDAKLAGDRMARDIAERLRRIA